MKTPMLMKPKLKIYAALLVATIALMVALGRCSRQYASKEAQSSGGDTIDVAIEYSPLSLYMYADTLGGFSHDLLNLIAKREHLHIKFHPMASLDGSLKQLREGTVDIVAAQMPSTSDFKQQYLFTDAVAIDKQVLVQRRGKDGSVAVKSQLDLAGKTVCVANGSPVATRIANLAREIGDSIHVRTLDKSQEQLFLLVAAGDELYAVVSDNTARSLAVRYADIDVSTAISFNQFQAWAMAKNDTVLLQRMNKWLHNVRQTDEYKQLRKRYNL